MLNIKIIDYINAKNLLDEFEHTNKPVGTISTDLNLYENANLIINELEDCKIVNISDNIYNIPAYLNDIYNADIDGTFSSSFSNINVSSNDVFLIGELINVETVMRKSLNESTDNYTFSYEEKENLKLTFQIDEVLAGYPEYAQHGSTVDVYCPIDYFYIADNLTSIEKNKYVIQGYYNKFLSDKKPYSKDLTLKNIILYDQYNEDKFENKIKIAKQNLHAVNIITTKDMIFTPDFLNGQKTYFLTSGRLIDKNDYADAANVCVVRDEFLKIRNLKIGDSITLNFPQNNFNYYREYITNDNLITQQEILTEKYTIIGSYSLNKNNDSFPLTVLYNDIYIPASSIPQSIIDKQDWKFNGYNYCFSLNSYKDMAEFYSSITSEHINLIDSGANFQWDSLNNILIKTKISLLFLSLIYLICLYCIMYILVKYQYSNYITYISLGGSATTAIRLIRDMFIFILLIILLSSNIATFIITKKFILTTTLLSGFTLIFSFSFLHYIILKTYQPRKNKLIANMKTNSFFSKIKSFNLSLLFKIITRLFSNTLIISIFQLFL